MNYIKRKLKTTSGLLTMILGLSILVLGVSYATFVITTDKYKASEMLITNLTYGINITGDSNSTINGKTVTVGANKTSTIQVKITSLNDISSNYSLEYKILSGSGKVTYLSSTSSNPSGEINKTGSEKTITVLIQASTELNIEFNVSGGYTYNGEPSTLTGYTKITGTSHRVTVTSTNTNYGTISNGSQVIDNNATASIILSPKAGYKYSSNTCGGIVSGNILTIKNITSNKTCTVSFIEDYQILAFKDRLLKDNKTILTRTDFDKVFNEENVEVLYKASGNETEDGSDVYYFAGNAQNNWVKFGKDQDDADLYWRIIRTNEDGSVRLLYIGPDPATTSAFIKIDGNYMSGGKNDTTGCYNCTNYNNTMYVGYMYGEKGSLENNRQNTKSAPIKTVTDLWYSKTLNVKTDSSGNIYDAYVSKTAIYCNDRSTDSYSGSGTMYYGASRRLSKSPSYKCGVDASRNLYSTADVADKFSVSTSKGGNGKLAYGVAQMTADEVIYAGGGYGIYAHAWAWYYYNSTGGSAVGDDRWWTMSPSSANSSSHANVFFVSGSSNVGGVPGFLYFTEVTYDDVNNTNPGIRPVLSLKSCVKVTTGNGSSSAPYEVSVDSTCASAEN